MLAHGALKVMMIVAVLMIILITAWIYRLYRTDSITNKEILSYVFGSSIIIIFFSFGIILLASIIITNL